MNPGVPANDFNGYANDAGITASTLNYVWDVGTLEFVPMSQPVIEGGTIVVGAVDQGAAGVSPWLVTGPLTDTQLRASPVPISGTVAITSATLATEATLSALNAKVTAVNTGAVVVSSSALPSGASTAALQTTGNTSLSSVDGKTPALGQQLAAASSPVVLTAAQLSTLTPPAAITGFALEAGHLAAIDTSTAKIPSQGQALAAASLPVVLTAAQIGTLTPPAAIAGFLTEADFDTKTGSLTETAPATDTASSGLNGRLQRIAQRITSLITALGTPFQAGGSIGNTAFIANAGTNLNTSALALDASITTLNTSVNTLLKPANTLAAVTTVATVTSLTQMNGAAISMNTGVRDAGTQRVTIATNDVVPVSDNSGSLTVDAPVGTPVFVRLSDGAAPITTLPVSIAATVAVSGPLTDAQLRATPVPISGTVTASSAATATAADPAYTEAQAAAFSQDLGGRLRTLSYGLVADAPPTYLPDEIKPLSVNTEGRLRVSVVPAATYLEFFRTDDELSFNVPLLTDAADVWAVGSANPYP